MVQPLSALFIMEPLSLPNQREPCKVEKIVLVPPDWKKCPGTPRLEKCPGTPRLEKMSWYPQIGKMSWYPQIEKMSWYELLQKCAILNKAINLHSRGPTEP